MESEKLKAGDKAEENRVLIEGLYRMVDSLLVSNKNDDSRLLAEAMAWINKSREYRKAVNSKKRSGILRLTILHKAWFKIAPEEPAKTAEEVDTLVDDGREKSSSSKPKTTPEPTPVAESVGHDAKHADVPNIRAGGYLLNTNAIANAIDANWDGQGPPRLLEKGHLSLVIRIVNFGANTYSKVTEIINKRTGLKGKLPVCLPPPAGHNVDLIFCLWTEKKILAKWDITRTGFYVLILNDGPEDGRAGAPTETYLKGCSRLNVDNPIDTAALIMPTRGKLRLLAKGKHFVCQGLLQKFPEKLLERRVVKNTLSTHGASFDEDVNDDTDPDLVKWRAVKSTYKADTTFNWETTQHEPHPRRCHVRRPEIN